MSEQANARVNHLIHAKYIIGILIALVAFFAALGAGWLGLKSEDFALAGTISSIILAVISIVYGFIANSATSRELADIRASGATVATSSQLISAAATATKDSSDRIANVAAGVTQTTAVIDAKISELASQLDDVVKTVQATYSESQQSHSVVREVRDSLSNKQSQSVTEASGPAKDSSTNIDKNRDEFLRKFYRGTSYYGRLLCYALKRASQTDKKFYLSDFIAAISGDDRDKDYFWGISVGIAAADIGNPSLKSEGTKDVITCTRLDVPEDLSLREITIDIRKKRAEKKQEDVAKVLADIRAVFDAIDSIFTATKSTPKAT